MMTKEERASKTRLRTKAWKARNPAKNREQVLRYRERHPTKVAAAKKKWTQKVALWRVNNRDKARDYYFKKTYGLSLEAYNALLERQHGECGVCYTDLSALKPHRVHLDHCHASGRIRGILCGKCNSALGFLGDSPVVIKSLLAYAVAHTEAVPNLTHNAGDYCGTSV